MNHHPSITDTMMAMNTSKPLIKGERRYPCGFPGCKWIFTRSNHVIRHHQRVHPGFNPTERPTSITKGNSMRNSSHKVSNSQQLVRRQVTSSPSSLSHRVQSQDHSNINSLQNSSLINQSALMNHSLISDSFPGDRVDSLTSNNSLSSSSLLLQAMKGFNSVESTKNTLKNSQNTLCTPIQNTLCTPTQNTLCTNDSSLLSSCNPSSVVYKCDQINCGQLFKTHALLNNHRRTSHNNIAVTNDSAIIDRSLTMPSNGVSLKSSLSSLYHTSGNNSSLLQEGNKLSPSDSSASLTNASFNLLRQLSLLDSNPTSQEQLSQLISGGLINPALINQTLINHSLLNQTLISQEESDRNQDSEEGTNPSILDLVLPKPHACPFDSCGKSFTRRDHLKRHILSFHVQSQANHPSPPESPSSGELNLSMDIASTSNGVQGNSNPGGGVSNAGGGASNGGGGASNIGVASSVSLIREQQSSRCSPGVSAPSPASSIPYVDIEPEVVLEVDESKIWTDPNVKNHPVVDSVNFPSSLLPSDPTSLLPSDPTSLLPSDPSSLPIRKRLKQETSIGRIVIEEDDQLTTMNRSFLSSNRPSLFSSSLIDRSNNVSTLEEPSLNSFPNRFLEEPSLNSFPNRFSFASGNISLRGKRPYMCDIGSCCKSYTKHSHLVRHKVETHKMKKPEPRTVRPGINGSRTSTSPRPVHHVSLPPPPINLADRPFVCDFPGCRWSFKRQYHLDRHFLTHRQQERQKQEEEERRKSDDQEEDPSELDQKSHLLNLSLAPSSKKEFLSLTPSSKKEFSRRTEQGQLMGLGTSTILSPSPSPHLVSSPSAGGKFDWNQVNSGNGPLSPKGGNSSPKGISSSPKGGNSSPKGRNESTFKCNYKQNEPECGLTFNSQHALQMHQYFVHSIAPGSPKAPSSHNSQGRSQDSQGRSQDSQGRSQDSQGRSSPASQGKTTQSNIVKSETAHEQGPKSSFFKTPTKTASKTLSEFSLLAAAAAASSEKESSKNHRLLTNGVLTNGVLTNGVLTNGVPDSLKEDTGEDGQSEDHNDGHVQQKMSDDLMYILSLRNILKAFEEQQQNHQGDEETQMEQTIQEEDEEEEMASDQLASNQLASDQSPSQLSLQQLQQVILMNTLLNGSSNQANNQLLASLIGSMNQSTILSTNTVDVERKKRLSQITRSNPGHQIHARPMGSQSKVTVASPASTLKQGSMNQPSAQPQKAVFAGDMNQRSAQPQKAVFACDMNQRSAQPQKAVFACDIPGCDKKFGRNCELTRHKLNHMDIWPFLCDYPNCGRKFKRKDVYKNHQRTHIKEDANLINGNSSFLGPSSFTTSNSLVTNSLMRNANETLQTQLLRGNETLQTQLLRGNETLQSQLLRGNETLIDLSILSKRQIQNMDQDHPLELSMKSR